MTRKTVVKEFEDFLDKCEYYRALLMDSRDAIGEIVRNDVSLRKVQKELISMEAKLAKPLQTFSRKPQFKDPFHNVVYSAYDNAFTDDVLIRRGRSLDAVIEDLVYIIARLGSISDSEFRALMPSATNKEKELVTKQEGSLDFWQLVHPEIKQIAESRYQSGHYADSVEASFKFLNSQVKRLHKQKTNMELDGNALMKAAFSPNSPTLVIQDIETETGKNMQQGFMEIFAGSMTGIRNPKAHDNINISDIEAQRYLIMASLLMYKIDGAKLSV